MNRIALTIATLLFATVAQAADYGPVEKVKIPGVGPVDYQHVLTETSQPGETMDAFAARLSPRLRAFSDETGFEACGVIATDGERFGAVIGSNRSHIACANFSSKVPEGMRPTLQTIHSHGKERGFNANRNDLALNGQVFAGHRGLRGVAGQNLREFSEMDYDGGAGYLATPEGTKHQAGHGTVRTVHAH
ncbi:hypothetical protein [Stenotrophomonas sp. Marseille-Q4652]|uniref:hypothetical protein n=1 Tax=Stenotrophomonas sp. Marseille-Q4652 TaxID=2866595 RepID=UPI001CE439F4|nr:hypothetical protein [Stenotrophomonas sp. Marseille-Q4652]